MRRTQVVRRKIGIVFLLLAVGTWLFIALTAYAADGDNCPPNYAQEVMDSYRRLQMKISVYEDSPASGKGIRLGIYQAQAACGPGATEKNLARLEQAVTQAQKYGVQLLSFPELYVPGYTLSPEEAKKVAEYKNGPSITRACQVAQKYGMALIVPYAEKADVADAPGGKLYYDSIAVIDSTGKLLSSYRKTHLYGQQERDNWAFGNELSGVFELNGFPVGVLNCYECEFPELSRILALKGAKLIVGPTAADGYYTLPNGQRSDVPYPDVSTILFPANAYANNIFFAYSNRAGYEHRGKDEWHYRGNSIIIGPHGDTIVAANHQQDTLLVADIIPGYYGMTHPAPEYNYLRDRRPGLYQQLVAPEAMVKGKECIYPAYKDGKEVPTQ